MKTQALTLTPKQLATLRDALDDYRESLRFMWGSDTPMTREYNRAHQVLERLELRLLKIQRPRA